MSEIDGAVVVGIDGSPEAVGAARWAGAVACRVAAPLNIVHALPTVGRNLTESAAAIRAAVMSFQRDSSEIFLKEAADAVRAVAPGAPITTSSLTTPVDEALVEISRQSLLIVLGGDKVTPVDALLLGSTTLGVSTRAVCPVVTWRGTPPVPSAQPVVVGVDGSRAGSAALAAAFEFASRFNVPLQAVHSWSTRLPAGGVTIPLLIDWDSVEAAQNALLAHAVDQWRASYPDVDVTCILEQAKPGRALLDHAADAQLVVVGTRGRNAVASAVLGSTSLNLLHHSAVPVMVCHASDYAWGHSGATPGAPDGVS